MRNVDLKFGHRERAALDDLKQIEYIAATGPKSRSNDFNDMQVFSILALRWRIGRNIFRSLREQPDDEVGMAVINLFY